MLILTFCFEKSDERVGGWESEWERAMTRVNTAAADDYDDNNNEEEAAGWNDARRFIEENLYLTLAGKNVMQTRHTFTSKRTHTLPYTHTHTLSNQLIHSLSSHLTTADTAKHAKES